LQNAASRDGAAIGAAREPLSFGALAGVSHGNGEPVTDGEKRKKKKGSAAK
jgi:hypothetical protein